MSYFDSEENVRQYIQMSEGYDGRNLVNILQQNLPEGRSVLEIGMGPGKDLDLLAAFYQVTGSDHSPHFLSLYRARNPSIPVMQLDAVTLDTDQLFDGIYSNKVLHGLNDDQLAQSFQRQAALLSSEGTILHSFWLGQGIENHGGDLCHYRQPDALNLLLPNNLKIVDSGRYQEMSDEDSFWVLLKISS